MRALRRLTAALIYRRALRALDRIERHLADQNRLLARLVDVVAPAIPESEPTPASAGVDFLNAQEAGLVLDYVAKTQRDTGRVPTEDEILRYLADEATVDLAARMEGR